jgi:hypothetical protein
MEAQATHRTLILLFVQTAMRATVQKIDSDTQRHPNEEALPGYNRQA